VVAVAAADAPVVEAQLYLELAAVFLGGLSGSIFAVQRRFPVTGELALGVATALGGGLLRDSLLGRMPAALTNALYLPVALTAALVGFVFGTVVMRRLQLVLDILDPVWMGLFAVLGAEAALRAGTTPVGAILVGSVTAVGGGVMRDVLAGEVPQLVTPGPINYFAGIAGAVAYTTVLTTTPLPRAAVVWGSIGLVVVLRLVALKYHVMVPTPPDLTRLAARPVVRRRGPRARR
jgi:uncharacterized membrane protein YeiH